MKKYFIVLFLFIGSLSITHAAEQSFQADLVHVKTYKGDNGKNNACNTPYIMVTETYRVTNTSLKNIIISHWSSVHEKLSVSFRKSMTKEHNYLTNNYCVNKGYKSNVNVKFLNSAGNNSNVIKFPINTDKLELLDSANLPVSIRN